jgi:hypothetical protein
LQPHQGEPEFALNADLATVLEAEAAAMASLSSSEFTLQASRQVLGKPG